jgi:hypothetical protein
VCTFCYIAVYLYMYCDYPVSFMCSHFNCIASYPMGTGGPFPGSKARPGRDADHSPPSSAEVKNE